MERCPRGWSPVGRLARHHPGFSRVIGHRVENRRSSNPEDWRVRSSHETHAESLIALIVAIVIVVVVVRSVRASPEASY